MVGSRRLSQAERRAATRAELLRTAAEVFARRGYHAASVTEIAEEAGFSHGAVYSNFTSKEELFLAVFEDYMATRAQELAETLAGAPDALPERARAMAAQWMDRFARDPDSFLLHLEFMVHAARDPKLSEKMGLRQASLRVAIERYLEEQARESGTKLPLSAGDLALIMRALGIGLAVEALNSPDSVRPALFGDFTELLFTQLLEHATAGEDKSRSKQEERRDPKT